MCSNVILGLKSNQIISTILLPWYHYFFPFIFFKSELQVVDKFGTPSMTTLHSIDLDLSFVLDSVVFMLTSSMHIVGFCLRTLSLIKSIDARWQLRCFSVDVIVDSTDSTNNLQIRRSSPMKTTRVRRLGMIMCCFRQLTAYV